MVDAPGPAVVLVRNLFDPNWHATVDGRPARVLPTDFVDQGVPVPPGHHTVVLTYDDPWVGYGAAGSALSIVLLLGLALVLDRRPGAREPTPGSSPNRDRSGDAVCSHHEADHDHAP
jgi:hypothetical protein